MTTPLIPDAERAAFEAHILQKMGASMVAGDGHGGYAWDTVQDRWVTWQAARRELLARQVAEWQTIDSAPKDTAALIWRASDRPRIAICEKWTPYENGDEVYAWNVPGLGILHLPTMEPTHWMPLPQPPLPDNSAFSKPDRAPYEDGYPYG